MSSPRRINRGPAAAAENRVALLVAAKATFAEHGLDAPLNLIARTAGVGQGSLYRHFPSREAIILAVFEENLGQLESMVANVDSTLDELLAEIVDQIVEVAVLFDLFRLADSSDPRLVDIIGRLYALFDEKLADDSRRGSVRRGVTAEEIFLAVGMLGALLNKTPESERASVAGKCWGLLLRALCD
ncbi:TetR/AcrR family transcriptional regulator [Nocardia sp. XZ_19_231]|uniref:TetR/AcrR family transcriptional regulator n=1 Tax=Nocardia sp. XZ_19_231 TaxID=2769252 RepID=UPI00188F30CE|nr:TetR/AcrR family transcriptional regulator [Nocardia sp. XZ_19_231]